MTDMAVNGPILARMSQPGPKEILTCDGGGIRGLISVEILARLEQDLRQKSGNPDLLLGDYFDFICGTSTGGIIAACLSAGMSMSQIRDFYVNNGSSMFERAKWYMKLHQQYEAEPLALLLQEALSGQLNGPGSIFNPDDPPVELGDPRLRGLGDVTPIRGPVPMRAGGVVRPLSIAGGLPGAYAPGAPSAVCMCCTRFGAVLPIPLPRVMRQRAQYSGIHP